MSDRYFSGLKAKKKGASWEKFLEELHAIYQAEGKAILFKTQPEFRVLRVTKSGFKGAFTGKGPPDYVGSCQELSFIAEAKTTEQARFSFSMIKEDQANRMNLWEDQAVNHTGAIFLWMRDKDIRYVIPWAAIRDRWQTWHDNEGRAASGTASLSLEQLDKLAVRFDETGWLEPLRKRINR